MKELTHSLRVLVIESTTVVLVFSLFFHIGRDDSPHTANSHCWTKKDVERLIIL